jgi:putative pantetheine hydrolase
MTRPGPRNAITDVPGIRVGHAERIGDGYLTGTTVVLPPEGGALAAVDVAGGGPATRDTAALAPDHGGARADAVVLTGGSSFGLSAASGVLEWLAAYGRGRRPVPDAPQILLPLAPAAALFDLGRGGHAGSRPDDAFGWRAVQAAHDCAPGAPLRQGNVGAGTGAMTAEMKGGTGTASAVLPGGTVVGALVAVNAHGSTLDPRTGLPRALDAGLPGEFALTTPTPAEHAAARQRLREPGRPSAGLALPNTVLAVLATDAPLTPARTRALARAGQRGLARAVSPVHGPTDGDTVFALAVGPAGEDDRDPVAAVLAAGELALARAVVHAVLSAEPVDTPFGHFASYRELYPAATAASPRA